jgi:predicted GH43/DUF377 family glycosyl hydrolase
MWFGLRGDGCTEKNWLPFEMPDGRVAVVYSQRPLIVIEADTRKEYRTMGLVQWAHGKRINGRTPPLLIGPGHYLSFFGGHVPDTIRGARYFMGAQCMEAKPPFRIIAATQEPLCWGSQASPTLLSSRPGSGYPACIFPAGVLLEGETVLVSCGVNDSYNVFLRYDLGELLAKMRSVDEQGRFTP